MGSIGCWLGGREGQGVCMYWWWWWWWCACFRRYRSCLPWPLPPQRQPGAQRPSSVHRVCGSSRSIEQQGASNPTTHNTDFSCSFPSSSPPPPPTIQMETRSTKNPQHRTRGRRISSMCPCMHTPDECVDTLHLAVVQVAHGLGDLDLVGAGVHQEGQGVLLLHDLHSRLGAEGVLDDTELRASSFPAAAQQRQPVNHPWSRQTGRHACTSSFPC